MGNFLLTRLKVNQKQLQNVTQYKTFGHWSELREQIRLKV